MGNDLIHIPTPEDAWEREPFCLPLSVPDEWLADPDLTAHPELAESRELVGLTW